MAGAFSRKSRFSKRLDISAELFYWSKAVGRVRERMRVADRDGIWSRGGMPVEELPDPFAPAAGAAGCPTNSSSRPGAAQAPALAARFSIPLPR